MDFIDVETEKSGTAHFIIYDVVMDELTARTGGGNFKSFLFLLSFFNVCKRESSFFVV